MIRKELGGSQVERSATIEEQVEQRLREEARRKAFKDRCFELRSERIREGIKFYDAQGSGRIRKGNKHYD